MGENSKIEWTNHTFNPWVGCTKVGPPCDHCYAAAWAKRTGQARLWEGERRRTTAEYWRQPQKWNTKAKAAGARLRVFCASLADVFDNQVPQLWRDDLWERIEQTPDLDWLLLTKRPQNIAKMVPKTWGQGWPNVWLGITSGDQNEFDRDWPKLRAIPAAVRFVSYEPALGPLRIDPTDAPDWIICGGESGPGARMMDPEWARVICAQCVAAGVPFFMKQMTGKKPIPPDLMLRQWPQPRHREIAADRNAA